MTSAGQIFFKKQTMARGSTRNVSWSVNNKRSGRIVPADKNRGAVRHEGPARRPACRVPIRRVYTSKGIQWKLT